MKTYAKKNRVLKRKKKQQPKKEIPKKWKSRNVGGRYDV